MRQISLRVRLVLLVGAALLASVVLAFPSTRRPAISLSSLPATNPICNILADIRRTGILRVGSTGDYDPFSFLDSSGELRGIDVEAAHRVARAIGPNVHVRFVITSWPTLTADLLADRFDIAMCGVSRNKSRGDTGALSRTYLLDAKIALIRSADRGKYRTLADLDRAGVTVLVNPGGTNQQFVRATIKNARLVVVQDNLAIPRMIAEGKGDVMFTDGAEGKVYSRRDPRLCVALTDPPLMKIEKVYYMARGQPALLDVVNACIRTMQADGTYARLWAKYVGE